MVWIEETGVEVQKGAAELRPCWVTPQKLQEHFTAFYKSRMKTLSEEAVGQGQQCLFVSLINKQHPEMLRNAEERSPWQGSHSSSWAQSRGVRRGSDRCQQRNQGQMEAGAMICLEVRMFSSLKEAAP